MFSFEPCSWIDKVSFSFRGITFFIGNGIPHPPGEGGGVGGYPLPPLGGGAYCIEARANGSLTIVELSNKRGGTPWGRG